MKRHASAKWIGTIQQGKGTISTATEAIRETEYSFTSRFIEDQGTNPEELIGAAHASCFSMALAGVIGKAGFEPQSIETEATITLGKVDGNWTITTSHLRVEASVPGIDAQRFMELADEAKRTCPVSRLLKADITFEARLKQASVHNEATIQQASAQPEATIPH